MAFPKILYLGCILLLMALVEASTPPGIANHPSKASCKIKKYKMCYNLEHVCPKFCPDGCEVECASCKPICTGGSSGSPPSDSNSPPSDDPRSSDDQGGNNDKGGKSDNGKDNKGGKSDDDKGGKSDNGKDNKGGKSDDDKGGKDKGEKDDKGDKGDDGKGDKGGKGKGEKEDKGDKGDNGKNNKGGKDKGDEGSSGDNTSPPTNPPPSTPPTPSTPSTPPYSPPTPPTPSNPPPSTSTPPSSPKAPKPSPSTPPYSPPTPTTPPPTPSKPKPPTSPSTPSTPSSPSPAPKPSTPSTPAPITPPTPSTPSIPPYPPPQTPSTPSSPTPSTPPPSPSPTTPFPSTPSSPQTPPSSEGAASKKRVRCKNKNYEQCYGQEHVCPASCPTSCEVDCVTCKPVCSCDYPGAVCQDPRFIGADGITFYFHGKKDKDFCLVTDPNLHINGHFIGKRNENMTRDFTWVQSIGVLFDNHRFFIGAQKTSTWDDANDRLAISFDGEPIFLQETEGFEWQSNTEPHVTITRARDTNNVIIKVEGKLKITAKVVPITEEESRVHNYGITKEDCFAHLDLGFKFHSLSKGVDGVLGKTYRDDYVSKVKMGISMPVIGGEKEFASSNLFATDCLASRFNNGVQDGNTLEALELANLKCVSGMDGAGVVCKR